MDMEDEEEVGFPPQSLSHSTITSCQLLIYLLNDAITMLGYLGMITEEVLCWKWIPIDNIEVENDKDDLLNEEENYCKNLKDIKAKNKDEKQNTENHGGKLDLGVENNSFDQTKKACVLNEGPHQKEHNMRTRINYRRRMRKKVKQNINIKKMEEQKQLHKKESIEEKVLVENNNLENILVEEKTFEWVCTGKLPRFCQKRVIEPLWHGYFGKISYENISSKNDENDSMDKEITQKIEIKEQGKEGLDPHANKECIYPIIEEIDDKLICTNDEGKPLKEDVDMEILVERLFAYAETTRVWKEEWNIFSKMSKHHSVVNIPNNGVNCEIDGVESMPMNDKTLNKSTWNFVCYLLNQEYARDQIDQLGLETHPTLCYLVECLEKIKKLALQRFSTTVVEDEAIESYRRDMFDSKALFEKEDQKWKNNLEDARQSHVLDLVQYQDEEKLIQQDKNDVVILAKKMEDKLKANFLELETQEFSVFSAEYNVLLIENAKMEEDLFDLQLKNRDKELQQRGKKGQSIEEIEELISTYEIEIKSKTEELTESTTQLKTLQDYFCKMDHFFSEKARMAEIKEDEERKIRLMNVEKRRKRWLPYYAAMRIQRYWARYRLQKHGSSKKGKGKGKKSKSIKGKKIKKKN